MLVTIDISNNQVVVEPTHLKNMIVKLDHIQFEGVEIKNIWNHHLDEDVHPPEN